MIRDRLPDVLRLARRNPNKYYEPEHQPDVAMDPAASLVLQRVSSERPVFCFEFLVFFSIER